MSSRDDVDAVRSRTDILQVVAPYVALKKSGRVWKGLCPFHNEKTPSFQVNPDLGRWHCFGQCSEGGDAFKFLQKVDGLTFPEALERLALKAGVVLSRDQIHGSQRVPSGERDRFFAAVAAAVQFYRDALNKTPIAQDYLRDRGLTSATIDEFELGYAAGDWDTLPRYLDSAGVSREDAVKAGVLVASDRGGHYDKLRGRIVFPIVDVQNRPIAFGGRLMQPDPERPKYLNSSETPLFSKSKTLYGMSRARKAIADSGQAIIVEGYLDVITCHQAGFVNVIATLGTSLTEEHAVIIGRQARRVLLAFDSDAAGVKAALRANSIFEAQEMEVRMLDMPKGDDPDSLISSGRNAEFQRSIDESMPIAEYRLRRILESVGPEQSEREKTTLFQRDILPLLRSVKSVIERERYIRMCAHVHPFFPTGATRAEEQIAQDVDGTRVTLPSPTYRRPTGQFGSRDDHRRDYRAPNNAGDSKIQIGALEKAEIIIIQALLETNPEYLELLSRKLKSEMFVRPSFYKLATFLLAEPGPSGAQAALSDVALQSDPHVTSVLLGQNHVPGLNSELLSDSVDLLVRHSEEPMLAKLRELSREGNLQANELYTRIMRQRKGGKPEKKLKA